MSWHDQLYFSSGSTVNNWLARQARFLLFSKTNRTNQQRQWFKKVLSSCKSFLPSQKQNGPMADDFWCQTKWLISCERKVSPSNYTLLSGLSIKKYYISWQQSETIKLMQLNTNKSIPCGELSLHTTGKFQWEIAIFIISPGINQSGPLRCTADVPVITFIDFFLRKLLPGRLHLSLVVLTHFLTDNWCQPRGRAVASRLLARAATNPTNRSVVQFTTTRKGVSGG